MKKRMSLLLGVVFAVMFSMTSTNALFKAERQSNIGADARKLSLSANYVVDENTEFKPGSTTKYTVNYENTSDVPLNGKLNLSLSSAKSGAKPVKDDGLLKDGEIEVKHKGKVVYNGTANSVDVDVGSIPAKTKGSLEFEITFKDPINTLLDGPRVLDITAQMTGADKFNWKASSPKVTSRVKYRYTASMFWLEPNGDNYKITKKNPSYSGVQPKELDFRTMKYQQGVTVNKIENKALVAGANDVLLEKVYLGGKIREVGSEAFDGNDLTYVKLEDSVYRIGYSAFENQRNGKKDRVVHLDYTGDENFAGRYLQARGTSFDEYHWRFRIADDTVMYQYYESDKSVTITGFNYAAFNGANPPQGLAFPYYYKGKPVTSVSMHKQKNYLEVFQGIDLRNPNLKTIGRLDIMLDTYDLLIPDNIESINTGTAGTLVSAANIKIGKNVRAEGMAKDNMTGASFYSSLGLDWKMREGANKFEVHPDNPYIKNSPDKNMIMSKNGEVIYKTNRYGPNSEDWRNARHIAEFAMYYTGGSRTSITLGRDIYTVGPNAFAYTPFNDVNLMYVGHVGSYAFRNSVKRNLNLGESLKTISTGAFQGSGAFNDSYSKIEIPRSIEYVGNHAFRDNKSLSYIKFLDPDTRGRELIIQSSAFANLTPFGGVVEANVNQTGDRPSHRGNIALRHASLQGWKWKHLSNYDKRFTYMKMTNENGVTGWHITGFSSFAIPTMPKPGETSKTKLTLDEIALPKEYLGEPIVGIAPGAFEGVIVRPTNFEAPVWTIDPDAKDFSTIGENAFMLSNVDSIDFANNIKYIGDRAFQLSNVNDVDFGNSVEYIGMSAFEGNTAFKHVDLSKATKLHTIKAYAFRQSNTGSTYTLPTPRPSNIDPNAFAGRTPK